MSLLNKKAVRQHLINRAAVMRPGWKPSRVSEAALVRIEADLIVSLDKLIHCLPSKGKTITY